MSCCWFLNSSHWAWTWASSSAGVRSLSGSQQLTRLAHTFSMGVHVCSLTGPVEQLQVLSTSKPFRDSSCRMDGAAVLNKNDRARRKRIVPLLNWGEEKILQNVKVFCSSEAPLYPGDVTHAVDAHPPPDVDGNMSTYSLLVDVPTVVSARE